MPAVTVLLRTLNPGSELPPLLDVLARQTVSAQEIVMVDSGSTDGSVAYAESRGVRLVPLEPARFTHALSTNLGFAEARGDVVAMLSQDALPTGPTWLESLIRPLKDRAVAAVFGRQTPRPGCYPLERWELERCYPAHGASPIPYSNVNSAARRAVWAEHPFDESLRIAEDAAWAQGVMDAGHRVVYASDAAVVHSHAYTLRQVYARCRAESQTRRALGPQDDGLQLIFKAWPRQTLHDLQRLVREGRPLIWPHAAAYRLAQFAGMVAGGRA